MSLKLTTSLSQRLVLTPQLRQRIEMLQMTTLELTDLIQQQILENPVLEEVATQEEVGELAEKILDHLASADPGAAPDEPQRLEAAEPELGCQQAGRERAPAVDRGGFAQVAGRPGLRARSGRPAAGIEPGICVDNAAICIDYVAGNAHTDPTAPFARPDTPVNSAHG